MITLITGLPGNGKTLYALQYVDAWVKRENADPKIEVHRQVWYHAIKGLSPALGWQKVPVVVEKVNGSDVEVPQWWLCPAGSIVIVDEAQDAGFGVRPRGQVPEWARRLEKHRHLGIDLVFITQVPKLLDSHDRDLCELHFHVMRTFGLHRATIHEFRPVRDNIKSRTGSIQHKWKYPKHVFEWYVSAEAHTHRVRIPMKVWVLCGLLVLLPALVWFTWAHYLDPRRNKAPSVASTSGAASGVVSGGAARGAAKLTQAEYLDQQVPRVVGLAYTAPVYDEVTKPVQAPYPAACVSMGDRCGCYTQQGTKLETSRELCLSIVGGGFFVAWQEKPLAVPAGAKRDEPLPSSGSPGWGGSFAGLPVAYAQAPIAKPHSGGAPKGGSEAPRGIGAQP